MGEEVSKISDEGAIKFAKWGLVPTLCALALIGVFVSEYKNSFFYKESSLQVVDNRPAMCAPLGDYQVLLRQLTLLDVVGPTYDRDEPLLVNGGLVCFHQSGY